MGSQWVADRNCWEYFGEDYRQATSFHDALTSQIQQARQEFYSLKHRVSQEHSDKWWNWYSQYLLCDDWKAMRQRVFARDGFKCSVCAGPAEQVHHLTYERVGYEALEDLVSICKDCHDAVHQ